MPHHNWPDTECPQGSGTTAADILTAIVTLAQADNAYNFTEILTLALKCAQNTAGGPADNHVHCDSVEKAFFFAQNKVWFKVAEELNHGHV